MTATEVTPLLPLASPPSPASRSWLLSPYHRLLFASLILSLSFASTTTPMLYSVRVIICDILYSEGKIPPHNGAGDRCAIPEVESQTAESIALIAGLTTFSAILNLFTTGYLTKRWGVKFALASQTAWPCLRNLCQTYAIYTGGRTSIYILQYTQLITILGGGVGFGLAANTYIVALVKPEERTGAFGVLQGVGFLGTAAGYSLGGLAGDILGAPAPFEITFCLLVFSTFLTIFFLPYIPPSVPEKVDTSSAPMKSRAFSFLSPLNVFLPRKVVAGESGKEKRYWGLTLLGVSAFLAVLATSFVPFLLQLTSTNQFGFKSTENGFLMSANSLVRALFLTLAFPRIIAAGRKAFASQTATPLPSPPIPETPTTLEEYEPQVGEAELPVPAPPLTDVVHGAEFDLVFARTSIFVDGCLTAMTMFASKGWHMYLAASILPLASGTAPASKGVVMEMVSKQHQADALGALALVEMLATVSTISLFGTIFSLLSAQGLARFTFLLNALLAFVSTFVTLFVRFPPASRKQTEV